MVGLHGNTKYSCTPRLYRASTAAIASALKYHRYFGEMMNTRAITKDDSRVFIATRSKISHTPVRQARFFLTPFNPHTGSKREVRVHCFPSQSKLLQLRCLLKCINILQPASGRTSYQLRLVLLFKLL